MTTETLSLFDPVPGVRPEAERPAASAPHIDPHLRAARRWSRQIRSTVDGSPQQTRAAHLICQHLLAMLHADRIEPRGQDRSQRPRRSQLSHQSHQSHQELPH